MSHSRPIWVFCSRSNLLRLWRCCWEYPNPHAHTPMHTHKKHSKHTDHINLVFFFFYHDTREDYLQEKPTRDLKNNIYMLRALLIQIELHWHNYQSMRCTDFWSRLLYLKHIKVIKWLNAAELSECGNKNNRVQLLNYPSSHSTLLSHPQCKYTTPSAANYYSHSSLYYLYLFTNCRSHHK